jgi:hypothetical protein
VPWSTVKNDAISMEKAEIPSIKPTLPVDLPIVAARGCCQRLSPWLIHM